MLTRSDLWRLVVRYLSGALSRAAFDEALGPASWDMHRWASPALQRLIAGIQLRLAEHDAGHLADEALRLQLLALVVADMPVEWVSAADVVGTHAELGPEPHATVNVRLRSSDHQTHHSLTLSVAD